MDLLLVFAKLQTLMHFALVKHAKCTKIYQSRRLRLVIGRETKNITKGEDEEHSVVVMVSLVAAYTEEAKERDLFLLL